MTAASWPDHLLTLAEWDALPQNTSRCYELVDGNYEYVAGDIAGTVTIPAQSASPSLWTR